MDRNWEELHHQEDVKTVKMINKYNKRSNIYLMLGAFSYLLAVYALGEICQGVYDTGKAMMKASQKITFAKLFADVSAAGVAVIVILALVGLFFMFKAMFKWEEADKLSTSRFFWTPDEEEIKYIEQRFDNDMMKRMLAGISPTDTESIEVGYKEVRINSEDGTDVFNFNQCGYSQLTNYGSKQMAYYLASHSFPEGFVIYQTKIAPVGLNRYIGGVTDIGGEVPPEPEPEKRLEKMLNWLGAQLKKIMKALRLRASFKLPKPEAGPSPADSGQIVINKGYKPNMEERNPL